MSGARRLVLSGIALTALLAVVALASHAHRPGGGSGGGSAETPKLIFEYGASIMFVLMPFGVLLVLWVASLGRRQKLLESGSVGGQFRSIATFAAVAIPIAYLIRHFVTTHVHQNPSGAGPGVLGRGTTGVDAGHGSPARFQWLPAVIVGMLILAIVVSVVAVIIWKRLRGDEWEREAALSAALDE